MSKGILFGIAAYALWGLFPIYWKSLESVPASEVLCHRMIWSLLFLLVILTYREGWSRLWLKRERLAPRSTRGVPASLESNKPRKGNTRTAVHHAAASVGSGK